MKIKSTLSCLLGFTLSSVTPGTAHALEPVTLTAISTTVSMAASFAVGESTESKRKRQFKKIVDEISAAKSEIISVLEAQNVEEKDGYVSEFFKQLDTLHDLEGDDRKLRLNSLVVKGISAFVQIQKFIQSGRNSALSKKELIGPFNLVGGGLAAAIMLQAGGETTAVTDTLNDIYDVNTMYLEEVFPTYVQQNEVRMDGGFIILDRVGAHIHITDRNMAAFYQAVSPLFQEFGDIEASHIELAEYLNRRKISLPHFIGYATIKPGITVYFSETSPHQFCGFSTDEDFLRIAGPANHRHFHKYRRNMVLPGRFGANTGRHEDMGNCNDQTFEFFRQIHF